MHCCSQSCFTKADSFTPLSRHGSWHDHYMPTAVASRRPAGVYKKHKTAVATCKCMCDHKVEVVKHCVCTGLLLLNTVPAAKQRPVDACPTKPTCGFPRELSISCLAFRPQRVLPQVKQVHLQVQQQQAQPACCGVAPPTTRKQRCTCCASHVCMVVLPGGSCSCPYRFRGT